MRAAEQALIDGGETVGTLMERAGTGAAEWVWRLAARRPVTVLCGPGNNGGDGYVIARELARRGTEVTVVAPLEPRTEAASAARSAYGGPIAAEGHGGVLVDCLFGSGLARPLESAHAALLDTLARRHALRVAVDLPSGVDSDTGVALNSGLPAFDVTLALGAWKFAHWLMPAAMLMGTRRLVPIGIAPVADIATLLARPRLAPPAADAHKYTRGLVLVVAGAMPGAALMACEGAMRAGAGAVRLSGGAALMPDVIVRNEPLGELLADSRTGAVLVGPGLGRDGSARQRLAEALAADRPTVVDADALALLYPGQVADHRGPLVLTPHEGELASLARSFGIEPEDKL
ncbi:MAG TPA: NAD(P)H-hydrate epimerase, partial [Croceibacterium sp.]|nr:NAD(P)H-hydrate epimerase [Croceibacterium sp.]